MPFEPSDSIPLLDAIKRYVHVDVPNYHRRIEVLCGLFGGKGADAWDSLSEDDKHLWIQACMNFLKGWALGKLRVWGRGFPDSWWHELTPDLAYALAADIDWGRQEIRLGRLGDHGYYDICAAPTVTGQDEAPAEQAVDVSPDVDAANTPKCRNRPRGRPRERADVEMAMRMMAPKVLRDMKQVEMAAKFNAAESTCRRYRFKVLENLQTSGDN